jgi:hypothetical protein
VRPLHGFETWGYVLYSADGATEAPTQPFAPVGVIGGEGSVTLEEAGTVLGDPEAVPTPIPASVVKGHLSQGMQSAGSHLGARTARARVSSSQGRVDMSAK